MVKTQKLITAADNFDILDMPFKNERERIKYMSKAYKGMSISKAFAVYYGMEVAKEIQYNKTVNNIINIEVGKIYTGSVISIDKTGIVFDMPGIKEEIICRESFGSCLENVEAYLATHDNKLMFEIREHKNSQYVVSVLNAYYKSWVNMINKAIDHEDTINVHIDNLVQGGYVCHTDITPLCELTGKKYTSSVFIPGSHIVLNIETDFEKWIGEDVVIVPQKFVEFRRDIRTGLIENSLVGSRKRVLQVIGMQNTYNIWEEAETRRKLLEMSSGKEDTEKKYLDGMYYEGTVTGIINSNKKTGIFVELNGKYITGLMPLDATELLDYRPGDVIMVGIKEFEVQEGKEPFVLNKRGNVVKCNTRMVFKPAK